MSQAKPKTRPPVALAEVDAWARATISNRFCTMCNMPKEVREAEEYVVRLVNAGESRISMAQLRVFLVERFGVRAGTERNYRSHLVSHRGWRPPNGANRA